MVQANSMKWIMSCVVSSQAEGARQIRTKRRLEVRIMDKQISSQVLQTKSGGIGSWIPVE